MIYLFRTSAKMREMYMGGLSRRWAAVRDK